MPRAEPGPVDDGEPTPAEGRRFVSTRRLRLGDVTSSGRLRLDALAAYVQDVATDDAADAMGGTAGSGWVLRRLRLRLGELPRLGDDVTLATWCDGVGARWAERRTDVAVDGDVRARASALWVHVDLATGRPAPLPARFHEVFAPSARGRRADHRLRHEPPPAGRAGQPWGLRVTDFDVLGHMNNAAYWIPVEEALAARFRGRRLVEAEMEHRASVGPGEPLRLVDDAREDALALWFIVAGEPRASTLVGFAGS